MGASSNPPRGNRRRRAAGWLVPFALLVAVLVIGVPAAGAEDPGILSISGSGPGPVTVTGSGWYGDVWLYQCSDSPQGEADFWSLCDQSTKKLAVVTDGSFSALFPTQAVIGSGEEGFPPGTVNWMGNHTANCQATYGDPAEPDVNCVVAATQDGQSFAWAEIPFGRIYGPLDPATVTVVPPATNLTDGQLVTVDSPGHRENTQAMTYICADYGYAFPGGCDPIPASELTIPTSGVYHHTAVPLPRFVWVNPPEGYGNPNWYDCANGCSVVVASADNLVSPYWAYPDPLLYFRAEPLEKNPELLTVTRVRVNRLGGITIEGKIDCTRAIAEWGQSAFQAGVNVSWKARQPIGRKSAVTAHYESAIVSLCHDPLDTDPATPPYPWATHPPITSPAIWWVYPDAGGKFAAGAMHVDVQVTGGAWWSTSPGADQYLLTGVTQWDGKAVKG